jgi:hypothetical protein
MRLPRRRTATRFRERDEDIVTFEMGCTVEIGEVLEMRGDVGSLFQIARVTLCNRAEQICFSKEKSK